jgi:signal transduction histidine kinase
MGQSLELLMPERLRGLHRLHVDLFARSHAASRPMGRGLNIIGLRADGREFPIESTVSQTLIGGQPQLTAVLRDVSERHRAENDMREVNRQLRELSASLQDVREQERTRIARELHDDLGQQLTGLKLELTWLAGRLKDARPPGADKVDEMRQMLDAAISSVRRISTELRPPILDDLGFGEAVAWQAGEFGKRSGLQITLDLAAADQVADDALATALFRIVQESLTNIARHANATRVQISLFELDDSLVLTVRDDGRGMADGHRTGRGIGLISMRERATALGGHLQVVSNPGLGTTVEVTVPRASAAARRDVT